MYMYLIIFNKPVLWCVLLLYHDTALEGREDKKINVASDKFSLSANASCISLLAIVMI